jgi:uncharacterized SAM-binding protein YcdF (DUF218 family)
MAGGRVRWRRALIVVAVLAVVAGALVWGVRRVGRWLVVEDALEPAQAIVVLSGSMPIRAREAAQIYAQGFAAEVWVIRPASPVEELQKMGIEYVGEEFYNQKVLLRLGVPLDAIRVLEKPALNTEEEVQEIAAELRQVQGKNVILVTSKAHTRRVKAIWKARVGEQPRALVRYSSWDTYDGEHWWRHTHDALSVLREVLGLANVWAGFPVRPVAE